MMKLRTSGMFGFVSRRGREEAAGGNLGLAKIVGIVFAFCAATGITSPAQTITNLHSFCSQTNCLDGAAPYDGLVQATDGSLYTTPSAGRTYGSGAIFKITPSGALTTIYNFCSQPNCADGANPEAGLVQAARGRAQQALQVLHSHVRSVVSGGRAVPVGFLPSTQSLNLVIHLPVGNQEELTSLIDRLSDPASPDYRHWLSVAEFTEKFGRTEAEYQKVVDFAAANGFAVTYKSPNRLMLVVAAQ